MEILDDQTHFGKEPVKMKRVFAIIMLMMLHGNLANADLLHFSFDDPLSDHSGNTDVIHMDFTFDDVSGDYTILLTADAANPFQGDFRMNINLFNPATGTTAQDPSAFEHNLDD